jgi:stearoyl-CoA desaturase (delta-9 desaturase)
VATHLAIPATKSSVSWKHYLTGSVPLMIIVHLMPIALFWTPFRWGLVGWLVASYALRMFAVTGGYHRYFSHRSYKLDRFSQFVMAFLAETSAQKGILWWAAHHRHHHRHSDEEHDFHSPWWKTFFHSHMGWIITDDHHEFDPRLIADFYKYPELRWINKWHLVPTVAYAVALFFIGGWPVLLWGYFLSTICVWHGTFTINSLSHLFGSRRWETTDESRNNPLLAFITMGEGWHNNHHYCMSSCRQGYKWWEYDMTWMILKALSFVGIVREMKVFREMEPVRQQRAA